MTLLLCGKMKKPTCPCFEACINENSEITPVAGAKAEGISVGDAKVYEFSRDLCSAFGHLSTDYGLCGKSLNYAYAMAFCLVLRSTAASNVNDNPEAKEVEFEALLGTLVEDIKFAFKEANVIKAKATVAMHDHQKRAEIGKHNHHH